RHLRLEASPFWLNDRVRPWPAQDAPRRAGVSAFGFGGTNVHLLLRETTAALPRRAAGAARPLHLLTWSAESPEALCQLVARYREFLNRDTGTALADLAFTAGAGRGEARCRLAVVVSSKDQLADKLQLLKDWPQRGALRGSLLFTADGPAEREALLAEALRPRLEQLRGAALARWSDGCQLPSLETEVRAWLAERGDDEPLADDQWRELYAALALGWVCGGELDWRQLEPAGRRVALPTYPFQRTSYWLPAA